MFEEDVIYREVNLTVLCANKPEAVRLTEALTIGAHKVQYIEDLEVWGVCIQTLSDQLPKLSLEIDRFDFEPTNSKGTEE